MAGLGLLYARIDYSFMFCSVIITLPHFRVNIEKYVSNNLAWLPCFHGSHNGPVSILMSWLEGLRNNHYGPTHLLAVCSSHQADHAVEEITSNYPADQCIGWVDIAPLSSINTRVGADSTTLIISKGYYTQFLGQCSHCNMLTFFFADSKMLCPHAVKWKHNGG